MRAGKLRHPVTFFRTTAADDDDGTPVVADQEVEDAWISIEPLRGREAIEAKQLYPTLTHRVRKRHGETITPDCWFEHKGRTFNVIEARNVDERDEMDELLCGEAVDENDG
jgi:SPP1 family predicted phage head-tail adaptor